MYIHDCWNNDFIGFISVKYIHVSLAHYHSFCIIIYIESFYNWCLSLTSQLQYLFKILNLNYNTESAKQRWVQCSFWCHDKQIVVALNNKQTKNKPVMVHLFLKQKHSDYWKLCTISWVLLEISSLVVVVGGGCNLNCFHSLNATTVQ